MLGQCSADERAAVEQWFLAEGESEEAMHICLPVLERMGCYEDKTKAKQAYKQLRRHLMMSPAATKRRRMRHRIAVWSAAAAVLAVTAFVSIFISTRNMQSQHKASVLAELSAAQCENLKATLPDSSIIILHPGSRVVYDSANFEEHREIMLFGDAYFKVTKNGIPFEVRCQGVTVNVLGTSFDISSHDSESEFSLSLYTGQVRLASKIGASLDTLTMTPGEIVKIDKHTGAMMTMNMGEMDDAGTGNSIYFFEKRLGDIAAELTRRTGRHIMIRNHDLNSRRVLAMFTNNETPEQIMEVIAANTGARIVYPDSLTIELY